MSRVDNQNRMQSVVGWLAPAGIAFLFLLYFYINPFLFDGLYQGIILVLGLGVAGFALLRLSHGPRLRMFFLDTRVELRKTIWPTRAETVKTTLIIVAAVIVIAIFLWLIDSFFSWIIRLFIG